MRVSEALDYVVETINESNWTKGAFFEKDGVPYFFLKEAPDNCKACALGHIALKLRIEPDEICERLYQARLSRTYRSLSFDIADVNDRSADWIDARNRLAEMADEMRGTDKDVELVQ